MKDAEILMEQKFFLFDIYTSIPFFCGRWLRLRKNIASFVLKGEVDQKLEDLFWFIFFGTPLSDHQVVSTWVKWFKWYLPQRRMRDFSFKPLKVVIAFYFTGFEPQ